MDDDTVMARIRGEAALVLEAATYSSETQARQAEHCDDRRQHHT